MIAVKRSVPVFRRRTLAPRKNSCAIVVATKAHNVKQRPDDHMAMPKPFSVAAVTIAADTGQRNESRRLMRLDFRQASSGAIPVSSSRTRPIGTIQTLKNGPATVRRSPVTASLSVGNIVAKRMKNAQNSRIQLLARNAASRETHESSSLRALRSGRRR